MMTLNDQATSITDKQKIVAANILPEIKMINYIFNSEYSFDFSDEGYIDGDLYYHELVRAKVPENFHFNYSIVVPNSELQQKKGILLFHGLNEKSWSKYLDWAKYLAEKTNKPVVLFPMAYHMNRAPKSWSDPRLMTAIANARKNSTDHNNSTFANAALSTRLESHPELFIYSGLQSCCDVKQLLNEVKGGAYELFAPDASFDIFAYSIGAFLAQILLLSNPDKLFDSTRLFLFCGGITFDRMNGNSKYIMDLTAFKSLLRLNERRRLKRIKRKILSTGDKTLLEIWSGLELMMYRKSNRKVREAKFNKMGSRITAVALKKDKVMPFQGIVDTLRGKKNNGLVRVEVIDFPYEYTHEQPFPVLNDQSQPLVNRCFAAVFDKAVNFFLSSNEIEKITK